MRFIRSSGGEHDPPRQRTLLVLAALVLMSAIGSQARANTIVVTYDSFSAGPGADTTWNYEANLTGTVGSTSTIVPGAPHPASAPPVAGPPATGDYFAINDIVGLDVADTLALPVPAGWTLTIELLTFTYIPGFPIDSAALPNVRWTRTSGGSIVSDAFLGIFSYVSSLSTFATTSYSGHDHKTSDGSLQSNYGSVIAAGPGPSLGVPLPAAAVGGMALFGLIGTLRRKAEQV